MTNTTTETREICPECSAPLFPAIDTGELECQACERIWRAQPNAGCPYCGAISYYSLAAKNKDEKLEGYKCDSCEGEFSEKELTEWVIFLSAVVDGCGQGTRWGLHSLAISLPPLYIGKIAKDRMDYLDGKKTLEQITNPAHCLDLITPYALDVTPQRASEVLSKSLRAAYRESPSANVFRKGQDSWILFFGSKEVRPSPKPCPALEEVQYLLRRPDISVHPSQLPAGDVQTLIATTTQIYELLRSEGSAGVSDLRDKDRYSQVTKIDGVQVDITEDIHKKFQDFQNGLKEELTTASLERSSDIESILKKTRALENTLEREQSQKAKDAKNAKKRISYLIDHKIRPHHKELARYLHKTIRREHNCLIYRPDLDQPIVWEV